MVILASEPDAMLNNVTDYKDFKGLTWPNFDDAIVWCPLLKLYKVQVDLSTRDLNELVISLQI